MLAHHNLLKDNRSPNDDHQGANTMPSNMLNTEAELRNAVIDRLIAASMNNGKAREASLERWRNLGSQTNGSAQTNENAA